MIMKQRMTIRPTIATILLAAIIAMCSFNSIAQEKQDTLNTNDKIAQNTEPQYNSKVIEKFQFKDATPSFGNKPSRPCDIYFVSTDGNDEDIEKMSLVFVDPMKTKETIDGVSMNLEYHYTIGVDVDTLEICTVTTKYSDGKSYAEQEYYISGNGYVARSGYYTQSGDYINKDCYFKERLLRREITEELYKYVSECMGDEAVYKESSKTIDGDAILLQKMSIILGGW
jgi:hypothetical protein